MRGAERLAALPLRWEPSAYQLRLRGFRAAAFLLATRLELNFVLTEIDSDFAGVEAVTAAPCGALR